MDAINQFLDSLENDGKSRHTINTYRRNLTGFASWYDEDRREFDIQAIEPRDIHRYFLHVRQTKRAKPATLNLARDTLSTFFTWAVSRNLAAENPVKRVKKVDSVKGAPKALSEHQIDRLIAAAFSVRRQRDRCIVITLLMTGLRESELCNLLLQDINFAQNTVTVYAGKGGKYREIPLPQQASSVLRAYVDIERIAIEKKYKRPLTRAYLFLGQRGPISRSTVISTVRRVGKQAGIEGCHPHQLRHTYATFILNKTGDLTAVSALLGHSSIATTQIYTRPSQELLAERVQAALGHKGTRSSGSE